MKIGSSALIFRDLSFQRGVRATFCRKSYSLQKTRFSKVSFWGQKCFFVFNFCSRPGGDHFGYNRLSFWAGRWLLKKNIQIFLRKFMFPKILLGSIHSFLALRSGQKNICLFNESRNLKKHHISPIPIICVFLFALIPNFF